MILGTSVTASPPPPQHLWIWSLILSEAQGTWPDGIPARHLRARDREASRGSKRHVDPNRRCSSHPSSSRPQGLPDTTARVLPDPARLSQSGQPPPARASSRVGWGRRPAPRPFGPASRRSPSALSGRDRAGAPRAKRPLRPRQQASALPQVGSRHRLLLPGPVPPAPSLPPRPAPAGTRRLPLA
ncbi:apidaecins type 14-like [Dryobates pubescens]|uniref:apidaecins type 14-like n=1 Tax=Dryobates pubescens TaxID=118200 RepID=UPI0023B8E82D|nr:apidaecins type 14-like [Dryobates pubescens]